MPKMTLQPIEARRPYRRTSAEELATALHASPVRSGKSWKIPCPAHNAEDPNLSIYDLGNNRGPAVKCHSRGCDTRDIWSAIHETLDWPDLAEDEFGQGSFIEEPPEIGDTSASGLVLEARYPYRYPNGDLYAVVLRWRGAGDRKHINQLSRVTQGGNKGKWRYKAHRGDWSPYRAHEMEVLRNSGQTLLIVEGEKAAHNAMERWPHIAVTTWSGGADKVLNTKWSALATWAGDIHFWPDNDGPGNRAMHRLGILAKSMRSPERLFLHELIGDTDSGDDVADLPPNTPYPDPEPWLPKHAVSFNMGDHQVWEEDPPLRHVLPHMGYPDGTVRYDTRHRIAMWQDEPGWAGWRESNDRFEAHLRTEISIAHRVQAKGGDTRPLRFAKESWRTGLDDILYQYEGDLFLDYVQECASSNPDTEIRTDEFLEMLFKIEPEYSRVAGWASQFLFLGPITRAMTPGAKLDETPVLRGEQGLGKSSIIAWLFPEQRRKAWFIDKIDLSSSNKVIGENLQKRVIAEIAEMAGMTKADNNKLKALMTSADDGGDRKAYAHNPEEQPRRSIFVGTTNDAAFLPPDDTGNRRWVPVSLGDARMSVGGAMEWLDKHRDELWAAAWRLYQTGVEARLPDDMADEQKALNKAHVMTDDYLEGAVSEALDGPLFANRSFTIYALLNSVLPKMKGSRNPDQSTQQAVGSILKLKGYDKRRIQIKGSRQMFWYLQDNDLNDPVDPDEIRVEQDAHRKDWEPYKQHNDE